MSLCGIEMLRERRCGPPVPTSAGILSYGDGRVGSEKTLSSDVYVEEARSITDESVSLPPMEECRDGICESNLSCFEKMA